MGEFAVEIRNVNLPGKISPENGSTAGLINLCIRKGEFFSLLGAEKSGISTTLRVIAGHENPVSGEIVLDGRSMRDVPVVQRPVMLIERNNALLQYVTIFDNLALELKKDKVSGMDVASRIEQILELVHLSGMKGHKLHQLSDKERFRFDLACVLTKNPPVIVLDEPLNDFSGFQRQSMILELKAIQQKTGCTFILATTSPQDALSVSDHVAVITAGGLIQVGTPVQVYERPCSVLAASLTGELNAWSGTVQSAEGDYAVVHIPSLGAGITGVNSAGITVGSSAQVIVRPEKIRLVDRAALNHNCFAGTVIDSIYMGPDTRLAVDLGGVLVNVREQNSISSLDPRAYYSHGQPVWVTLFPENTLVVAG